ncbi:MAG: hypothetical protein NT027_16715 [Proteobacteria bacterium]|nr:hypothetical protein [Pseudomonadota bacterium]
MDILNRFETDRMIAVFVTVFALGYSSFLAAGPLAPLPFRDTVGQYSKMLSDAVAQPLKDQSKKPLCFVSEESSYDLGVVRNCIVRLGPKQQRAWFMFQKINVSGEKKIIKNLIAIQMDMTKPKTASAQYLELDRTAFDRESLLKAVPFKVPCLVCHSSGPRVIRPTTDSYKSMSENDRKLLQSFNEEITSYNSVATTSDGEDARLGLFPKNYEQLKKIKVPIESCRECHNQADGVRSELSLAQKGTIAFMSIHSGKNRARPFMPGKEVQALSKEELSCLSQWLGSSPKDNTIQDCGSAPEATRSKSSSVSDASVRHKELKSAAVANLRGFNPKLEMKATLSTSIHDVQFSGFQMLLNSFVPSSRSSKAINLEIALGLTEMSSGNRIRDAIAKKIIGGKNGMKAKVKGIFLMKGGLQSQDFNLEWRGQTKPIVLNTQCNEAFDDCDFNAILNLTDFELTLPRSFGVKIQNIVKIEGRLGIPESLQFAMKGKQ